MLNRTPATIGVALLWLPALALAAPALPGDYDPRISLAPLVEAVQPAVVSIEVSGVHQVTMNVPPMYRHFFGAPPSSQPFEGEGSGFVISDSGLVLTNHHVVGEASQITVVFDNSERVQATLVGSDPNLDVALLQLAGDRVWPYVALGSSESARVGDRVVAVGNPLGLGLTVTTGILSGKGRHSNMSQYQDFLQTDAAINPGNSGGPLFTLDGRVVGMNTAIIQGANTVGFAVPSDAIQDIVEDLRTEGRVRRGYLGIVLQELTPQMKNTWGVDAPGGVVISDVQRGLPADLAGIRPGDVIVGIDGSPVSDMRALIRSIGDRRAGDDIALEVFREGRRRSVTAHLAERDAPQVASSALKPSSSTPSATRSLGIEVVGLPASIAAQRRLAGGLLIESVLAGSQAAGVLEAGDILLQINRRNINTPDDLELVLRRSTGAVTLLIVRGDEQRFVVLSQR